jgi:hypothetical protein
MKCTELPAEESAPRPPPRKKEVAAPIIEEAAPAAPPRKKEVAAPVIEEAAPTAPPRVEKKVESGSPARSSRPHLF